MSKQYTKTFKKFDQSSSSTLQHFEGTINRLRSDNEDLAQLHSAVQEEIESLVSLKNDIVERISTNNNAITGIERVVNGS